MLVHLVKCSSCGRRFDATGRAPQSKFRCPCSAEVVVPEPKSHDAAVVRCGSCGSPRTNPQASSCEYCGASYTLNERDLGKICPGCFARVSTRGEFCHHCGEPLSAEMAAGETTDIACPVCGSDRQLTGRHIGGHDLLECTGCLGLWIGHESFRKLRDQAKQGNPLEGLAGNVVQPVGNPGSQRGPLYRTCPVCDSMMNRRNFGSGSGVIIDYCKDHGVWFDAEELTNILRWVRDGGLEHERDSGNLWRDEPAKKERKRAMLPLDNVKPSREPTLMDRIFDVLKDMFEVDLR
jgi:Zn-finger nucleic acid-binding protein